MAMYYCKSCDNYIDDDYHPCVQHPSQPLELICPDCAMNQFGLDPWTGEPMEPEPPEPTELDEWRDFDEDC